MREKPTSIFAAFTALGSPEASWMSLTMSPQSNEEPSTSEKFSSSSTIFRSLVDLENASQNVSTSIRLPSSIELTFEFDLHLSPTSMALLRAADQVFLLAMTPMTTTFSCKRAALALRRGTSSPANVRLLDQALHGRPGPLDRSR